MEDLGPQKACFPITLSLRILQQHTQREKLSVAAVTIRIHYSKMVTMLRADTPDMGDGHAATEAEILRRFRDLVSTVCPPDLDLNWCNACWTAWMWKLLSSKAPLIGPSPGSSFSLIDRRNQEYIRLVSSFHWNRLPYGHYK